MSLPKLSDVEPYLLTTIGTPFDLQARGAADTARPRVTAMSRTYASRYVGVTEHRGRWVSAWGTKGNVTASPAYQFDAIGEWRAAYARMRALGRDYIEVRPPEQVRPPEPPPAPISERGHATKRLGGRRIA